MRDRVVRRSLPDFANDVGRLVLRFVVGARQHLGEQAERDELHADEEQHHAEQQQRPIGDACVPNRRT